ncbi:MAG: polyribonucleotide nucleotidyltransferase, partial [Bacteroidetes bacterium]
MTNYIQHSISMPGGEEIVLETGRLARQADGAVLLKQGNTMLLATAVANKDAKDDVDFMPLTVEYKEKFAASGRIPGGFLKREGRPSDYEILIARLIDRALRPLFPKDFHADTQVIVQLISSDNTTPPDALACLAAAAALAISDIPFNGPVSEVRVARINGEFVINPDINALENADIDLMVAGTPDSIMMVEGEMKEVSEEEMLDAIKKAHETIKVQCQAINEFAEKVGKKDITREYQHETSDEELYEKIKNACFDKCYEIAKQGIADKQKRKERFAAVLDEFLNTLSDDEKTEKAFLIKQYYHQVEKEAVRQVILKERVRLDGRKLDEIRPIWAEVDFLPGTHGSAVFTRGETQSLTTVTLGNKKDEQMIDGAFIEGMEDFILHYNFPPFSTGEARPLRGTSRREVGHGNLAQRALKQVMPEDFPYTVRVVSDILESNGSSSMATVCAGSLALMDAGVPVKTGVSGIAMGLITDSDGNFAVLSDILGDEDHLGDMDFKVAGTTKGLTACQMDIKIQGLSYEIMEKALEQSKAGRAHILNEMNKVLSEPRPSFKPNVPRMTTIEIDKEFIGAVIGPGGKVIQEIQNLTNTEIFIEEKDEKGIVQISGPTEDDVNAALEKIKGIVAVPEVGEVYHGKVKNITSFGAFIEILPGKEGLLHISEIDWKRLEKVDSVLKPGD